ncbi:MAG: hypothetical protein GC203_21375 [Phenylobacterium sp.]|uniref:sensor histidine kinase n=1 Tax=Phenylobacterium sp. TaxID=1871053 RepID=UPI0025D4F416|nr:ATP-binding protein [Phenylobacterium sp.]MBI1200420.1 hypothetical protein [Phenylobacterium sp.]
MSELAPHDEDEKAALEAELADFSYIVSHDLAAVFRHMQAFSGLLGRDLAETATARQRELIARIDAASTRGEAMLDELRACSRLQRRPLLTETCDCATLVEAARLQLDAQFRGFGARLTVAELGPVVTDPVLFVEALRRILDNALKFARPGEAPDIEIRRGRASDGWSLRISDRGVGVDAGQEERVFQMFHQLDRETDGVGAGLAVARRVVRRLGGDVRILPQAQGACVEIRLAQRSGES